MYFSIAELLQNTAAMRDQALFRWAMAYSRSAALMPL
jgi:hypothetical protein